MIKIEEISDAIIDAILFDVYGEDSVDPDWTDKYKVVSKLRNTIKIITDVLSEQKEHLEQKDYEFLKLIGPLEDTVYGNTFFAMTQFERADAKNKLREELAKKLGYSFRYTGVNEGHWEKTK
jgi:hypothetical protein